MPKIIMKIDSKVGELTFHNERRIFEYLQVFTYLRNTFSDISTGFPQKRSRAKQNAFQTRAKVFPKPILCIRLSFHSDKTSNVRIEGNSALMVYFIIHFYQLQ